MWGMRGACLRTASSLALGGLHPGVLWALALAVSRKACMLGVKACFPRLPRRQALTWKR